MIVELSLIDTATRSDDPIALPTTLPAEAVLLTRLRTLASIGQPFVCDAIVQETSVRMTGAVTELDGGGWRVSLQYTERFGLSVRHIKSRIDMPEASSRIIGSLLRGQEQDLLVLTVRRRSN